MCRKFIDHALIRMDLYGQLLIMIIANYLFLIAKTNLFTLRLLICIPIMVSPLHNRQEGQELLLILMHRLK